MEHHGSAGTALLGLEGFVLLGVSDAYGELEQVIETTADAAWCRGCGVAAKPHGRRRTLVRDLPSAGRAVTLLWLKLLADPRRLEDVSSIGVDETSFLAANRFHHTEFITGIVALPGPRRPQAQLLDVMPGRTKAAVPQWISARPPDWRAQVTTCSLDPFRGYATALSTSLPHATRVLDAFHVVRLGLAAVDDVRRRVQQQTLGHRGHRDDPLYRGRRLLRRSFTTLNQRQWTRLENTLVHGDPTGQLTQAWMAAQELMMLYSRSHDLTDAKHRLWRILERCARSDVPELLRLARTLHAWQGELLAQRSPRPAGARRATDRPKPSTCSSRRSSGSGTASATSTTTGYGCCSRSVWTGVGDPCTGRLRLPPRSEAAHHAWWRRACLTVQADGQQRPQAVVGEVAEAGPDELASVFQ